MSEPVDFVYAFVFRTVFFIIANGKLFKNSIVKPSFIKDYTDLSFYCVNNTTGVLVKFF